MVEVHPIVVVVVVVVSCKFIKIHPLDLFGDRQSHKDAHTPG